MVWNNIYIIVLVLSLSVGIFRLKYINNSNKVFLLLLLITIFAEKTAYFISFKGVNNLIVYHIFAPIQCSLVFLGYYFDTKNKLILYTIPLILILSLVMSLWIQPLPEFNSYYMDIELLLFTTITIVYFKKLLSIETLTKLSDYPLFWISCGLLIFSVSNIFIFGAFNFVIKYNSNSNKVLIMILSQVRYVTNYIYYSSFIVAFLVKQNTISDQYGK